jgi:class 3 adenylate cyclase
LKTVALAVLVAFAVFFVIYRLSTWRPLLDAIDVDGVGDPAALPLLMFLFGSGINVTSLLTNWVSRRFERICDVDALEFTRDASAFIETMHALALRNLGELDPSWWHRIRSSHPPPAERLALADWWRTQRKITVLFTDIEESTALVERLGDRAWYELLSDHDEIVRGKVAEHRGTEVDSAGDGYLLVFEDAGEALLCAIEIQRDLEDYAGFHPDAHVRVRMGLHTGEVIRRGKQVYGRDVHLAARVAAQARGGEIAVSGAVRDVLADAGRFTFGRPYELELKGLAGTHRVHAVDWGLDSPVT